MSAPVSPLDATTEELSDAPEVTTARWITLAITIVSAFIVVLDNTVLNVSIPTILRDLHTTLPSLEWVITGYALTFATLLIIGGRLGDIFGHRRVFLVGVGLFGIGSFLASVSHSVGQLILGEAIIEGIGASLMLPTTLAILSSTFQGRARAMAFAAWGATAGVAAAAGPVVGGFLTTNYSWRWSFRINVIVAPLAIIGALLFMTREPPRTRRLRIDVPGALLIASGMFSLVFALSEGGVYGWWRPLRALAVGHHVVWPASRSISAIPAMFVIAAVLLTVFVAVELTKERRGSGPLFEFAHFKRRTYRYGLITSGVVAMGQLGLSFVLPVFLQDAKHLTAARNGLWLVPSGVFVIIGAQLAGRLIQRWGTTVIVRIGLVSYAFGIAIILVNINLSITAWRLLPGLMFYGCGIGFAGAQLTNVVLSEIPAESSGVASGANTTARQVGAALGVSVIGSLLTVQTIRATTSNIKASALSAAAKAKAIAAVHASGSGFTPDSHLSATDTATLRHAAAVGVATGTRIALIFAIVVILIGTGLSWLIPSDAVPQERLSLGRAEPFEPFEPLDPDPVLVTGAHSG